jgi:hypothetical protein
MKTQVSARRPGVAGILMALIIFALIFIAGFGYVLYEAQANQATSQADVNYLSQQNALSLERLALCMEPTAPPPTGISCKVNPSGSPTSLEAVVNDTGALPLSVVSWYIKSSTGTLVSPPGVVQMAAPLNLNVGGSGAITLAGYSYPACTPPNCPIIFVYLVTSRGNVFSLQFPLSTSTTVTTLTGVTTMTVTAPGVGGGNSLVVVMAATPVQTYSGPCPGQSCITDNVTVYNYSNSPIGSVTLCANSICSPATTPSYTATGTVKITPDGCSGPYTPPGTQSLGSTIPGYSGTGLAPHIFFLCYYAPSTGTVGGLVSFTGGATGVQGSPPTQVYSSTVTSNLVQVGSLVNPLAQGAFSTNFFFFKWSACTNTASSCTTNVSGGMPPSSVYNLPEGAIIPPPGASYSINNLQYVAFYIQLTNNFNTTLPIMATSFEQFEPSGAGGSETDYWIVGSNTTMTNGVYYPSYKSTPSLTAYPNDCATVNQVTNKPTDPACIYIEPGKTVTITFAACGPSVSSWDWGTVSSSHGSYSVNNGGSGAGCTSSSPFPSGSLGPSAMVGDCVIQFEYNGVVYAQDLQFQGVAFT